MDKNEYKVKTVVRLTFSDNISAGNYAEAKAEAFARINRRLLTAFYPQLEEVAVQEYFASEQL